MAGIETLQDALAQLRGHDDVGRGLGDAMAPLKEYDARHGADLAHTLVVFVHTGGNTAATAEALFLHRNSVTYRLQRIREVGGLDVRDPEIRRLLMTALYLADQGLDATTGRKSDEGERKE